MYATSALLLLALLHLVRPSSASHLGVQAVHLRAACELAHELKQASRSIAFHLKKLSAQASELAALQQDLTAIRRHGQAAVGPALQTLSQLVYQAKEDTLTMMQAKAASGVMAAARAAQLAGRIDEAATMLLATKAGSNVPCVATAAGLSPGARTSIDVGPCTKEAGEQQPLVSQDSAELQINIEAKFKATSNAAAGAGGSGNTCLVLQRAGGGNPGLPNDNANFKIMGGLLETTSAANTAANWKGGEGNWPAVSATYAAVDSEYKAFIAGVVERETTNTKLISLTDETKTEPPALAVQPGSFGEQEPKAASEVSSATLKTVKQLIKKQRTEDAGQTVNKKRRLFFLQQLNTNWTACELGAKPNPKENCEVTKAETTKCEGKEQEDCRNTQSCEWKDSTCKLTETAQKEAEKAKQEKEGTDGKTNTNTTGSNSFVISKVSLLLAFLHIGSKLCETFLFLREFLKPTSVFYTSTLYYEMCKLLKIAKLF
uniref:Variant surface glycoprotein n=1 Tax=Trypanosoma brucei TaxID=5691 RepID=A0A1V0FXY3_9TRYP|nr:variant surface glycoprotein [Trypanosoma brucei]